MKKKFMMLSCIAAVAIATVVGKKTYESHAYETSSLLMQNVEALAEDDGEGADDYESDDAPTPCKDGTEFYATIGTGETETTVRTHYMDGEGDSPGLDVTTEVKRKFCIGTGVGKKKGLGNAVISETTGATNIEPCLGPRYHTPL